MRMRTLLVGILVGIALTAAPRAAGAQSPQPPQDHRSAQYRLAWKTADGITHHARWVTDLTEPIFYASVEEFTIPDRTYWVEQKLGWAWKLVFRSTKKIPIQKHHKEANTSASFSFIWHPILESATMKITASPS